MKEFNESSFVDVPLDDWTVDVETTADALRDGLYSMRIGRYRSRLLMQKGKFRYEASEGVSGSWCRGRGVVECVDESEEPTRLVLSARLVGDWVVARPVDGLEAHVSRRSEAPDGDTETEDCETSGLGRYTKRGAAFLKAIYFELDPQAADSEEAKVQLWAAAEAELEDAEQHGGLEQLRASDFPFEGAESVSATCMDDELENSGKEDDVGTQDALGEKDGLEKHDTLSRTASMVLEKHEHLNDMLKRSASWIDKHGY